jgi:hypothetical protein
MDQVLEAVRDPEWQKFRKSLRGMDTASKLNNLRDYYTDHLKDLNRVGRFTDKDPVGEYAYQRGMLEVQVDNYLKALARGGQLYGGVSLKQALAWDWNLRIRK